MRAGATPQGEDTAVSGAKNAITDWNRTTRMQRTLRALLALAVFDLMLGLAADGWRGSGPDRGHGPPDAADARLIAPAHAGGGDPPPVAEAGFERTVAVGETVALDGTGSLEPRKGK